MRLCLRFKNVLRGRISLVYRNAEDEKSSLITGSSISVQDSTISSFSECLTGSTECKLENHVLRTQSRRRTYKYKEKRCCGDNGIFSAPAGVSPHHVTSSVIRRSAGGSRLIFVWPQKPPRNRILNIIKPLVHGALVGLLLLDAVHLWPGEFLPRTLPSSSSMPLPPVKCNIIEPRWFDNN